MWTRNSDWVIDRTFGTGEMEKYICPKYTFEQITASSAYRNINFTDLTADDIIIAVVSVKNLRITTIYPSKSASEKSMFNDKTFLHELEKYLAEVDASDWELTDFYVIIEDSTSKMIYAGDMYDKLGSFGEIFDWDNLSHIPQEVEKLQLIFYYINVDDMNFYVPVPSFVYRKVADKLYLLNESEGFIGMENRRVTTAMGDSMLAAMLTAVYKYEPSILESVACVKPEYSLSAAEKEILFKGLEKFKPRIIEEITPKKEETTKVPNVSGDTKGIVKLSYLQELGSLPDGEFDVNVDIPIPEELKKLITKVRVYGKKMYITVTKFDTIPIKLEGGGILFEPSGALISKLFNVGSPNHPNMVIGLDKPIILM